MMNKTDCNMDLDNDTMNIVACSHLVRNHRNSMLHWNSMLLKSAMHPDRCRFVRLQQRQHFQQHSVLLSLPDSLVFFYLPAGCQVVMNQSMFCVIRKTNNSIHQNQWCMWYDVMCLNDEANLPFSSSVIAFECNFHHFCHEIIIKLTHCIR